ncbi:MAG TPA: hypothetical protein VK395_32040 [Gemmataceae bacterium]|nr:hypothetical protein [Gemmataceae bacterium]
MKNVTALGKMTIFYVPSHKLDAPSTVGEQTARARIHDFLMQHYKAYTHTPSPVKGFWLSRERVVLHDVLERFEVSFGSESAFRRLVLFLHELCRMLGEEAIYLTRGEQSFLVNRDKNPSS